MNQNCRDFSLIKLENNKVFSKYKEHSEASEYGGCEYYFDNSKYIQRTSKTTPKKIGQFVTLWNRNKEGITTPFNNNDKFDYVVIICHYKNKVGRFLFPKEVLLQHKILSNTHKNIDGKRGFRVYPAWDVPINKQAILTKSWQILYFSQNLRL